MGENLKMDKRKSTSTNHSIIRLFDYSVIPKVRQGFTLIELLVVIGIIAVLIGVSVGGYSSMTKAADKANAQELVNNVATALTALYQQEGNWPKRLATGARSGDGQLDEEVCIPLAKRGCISLTTTGSGDSLKLAGNDRFGIITPWATAVVKRRGSSAQKDDRVGTQTVEKHRLHYALDLEGRGVVEARIGGETVKIRATAAVWCIGKSGGDGGDPWPYSVGDRKGDVYSWTRGQTKDVN